MSTSVHQVPTEERFSMLAGVVSGSEVVCQEPSIVSDSKSTIVTGQLEVILK